jgi:hypothetical protein
MNNNKSRIILGGALIGAITGLVGAVLLTRRAERTGNELAISSGEGMKIGVLVFGLLRAIASLADEK